ncbi:subtilisin-like protease PR1I [Pochonia chlamydosporia 170]|uniref:Subtilisin-like protease PR1I n=1 Tax=Pochonia chlamydosporia 170 TaxID=1380566 RepID=A0A179G2G7_METCM|nr:subtilisin-like protease PR1I [Pochonia chlamydosporia 170]OAQ71927.1 subtilisin-like protease PR1I [Pochonia chlamydosporia 170]
MYFSLLLLLPSAAAAPASQGTKLAPLITPPGNVIANRYIVKFKESAATSSVSTTLLNLNAKADAVYTNIFNGFSGTLSATALEQLRNHVEVDYIEQDSAVTIHAFIEQPDAPWGISRISHQQGGNSTYVYDESAGSGTCTYVIDTGVDGSHPDFEGRAFQIKSFIEGQDGDGDGHGTHCAGTIGSKTYGIAKQTTIYGIKVLDNEGSGTISGVIAGMDFAMADSQTRSCPKGIVANMSLGGRYSLTLNRAAARLVEAGIFLGVAAGNSNSDASYYSPASEPTVCTVGATQIDDSFASYSNYGSVVDILAPGTNILSTWIGGRTNIISGTSMATPHVVGLAAYLASLEGFPGSQALCERIRTISTQGAITKLPPKTTNFLAFNGNPSA